VGRGYAGYYGVIQIEPEGPLLQKPGRRTRRGDEPGAGGGRGLRQRLSYRSGQLNPTDTSSSSSSSMQHSQSNDMSSSSSSSSAEGLQHHLDSSSSSSSSFRAGYPPFTPPSHLSGLFNLDETWQEGSTAGFNVNQEPGDPSSQQGLRGSLGGVRGHRGLPGGEVPPIQRLWQQRGLGGNAGVPGGAGAARRRADRNNSSNSGSSSSSGGRAHVQRVKLQVHTVKASEVRLTLGDRRLGGSLPVTPPQRIGVTHLRGLKQMGLAGQPAILVGADIWGSARAVLCLKEGALYLAPQGMSEAGGRQQQQQKQQ
jgi:hypothetical protein